MQEFVTHSREETVAAGRALAGTLPPGALIAFTGGLGAGKTAFCQGIAEGLGCTDPVSSPTFAIVNYYRGPRPFAHFDLYRIHTENDLAAAGFYDYLDMGAVVACEWSENCAELLALENPIKIHIERVDETTRKITIGKSLCGCRGRRPRRPGSCAAAARLRRHEGMPPYALLFNRM